MEVSDQRGQTAPAPPPPPDDFSGFYGGSANIGALPVMRGPDDMPDPPQPTLSEMWSAGRLVARGEKSNAEKSSVFKAYAPIIEQLNRSRDEHSWMPRLIEEVVGADPNRKFTNPGWFAERARTSSNVLDNGDETRIWEEIQRRRDPKQGGDPSFLPGVPKTKDEFYTQITQRDIEERAGATQVDARNRTTTGRIAGMAGGMFESFTDPAVVVTLPIGGGGKTIATRILTEGLSQAGVQAILEPKLIENRARLGEATTTSDVVSDIVSAGVSGGVFQGAIAEPASALLRRFLSKVPVEQMTDAERAAVSTLQRGEEVDQTSPFVPGAGTEAHAARLDETMRNIAANLPGATPAPSARANLRSGTALGSGTVGRSTSATVDVSSAAARQQFKSHVHSAEVTSTNDYNAKSGAMGPYQFLASTWNRYYVKRYGRGGLSDDQIAAKRRDPQINEVLMDDLTADNAAHLRRMGVRETAGNLYLEHFAGQGGAEAIFRAAPDTPVERLLSPKAIENNPFLRGSKTAQDVIDWAHRRMGETPGEAPVVRRDQFADGETGDAEWQRAQHESDVAEAELARVQGEEAAARAPEFRDGEPIPIGAPDRAVDLGGGIDPNVEARGSDWGASEAREAPTERTPVAEAQSITVPLERGGHVFDLGPTRIDYSVAGDGRVEIGKVETSVSARGQGGARAAMQAFLDESDRAGKTVFLTPDPMDRSTQKGRLTKFYQSLGFVPNKGRARDFSSQQDMLRTPREAPAAPIQSRVRDIARAAPGKAWSAAIDHGTIAAKKAAPAAEPLASSSAESGIDDVIGATFSDPVGTAAHAVARGLTHDLNQALETGELGDIAFAADGVETAHGGVEPRYRTAKQVLAELDADDAAIAALKACL